VGEPEADLVTAMPVHEVRSGASDPWAFLEPLDESRTMVAQALKAASADDTALA
jgi:hypothetical protein